tara:strand:+ start:606 stop:869 length:264 start_codon:yes stop_codon:yes gene_type:complete
MNKIIKILMFLVFLIFNVSIFKYYLSNKNIKETNFNRKNIDQAIIEKTSKLPILINDTNNVIKFNELNNDVINNTKSRKYWKLLKTK